MVLKERQVLEITHPSSGSPEQDEDTLYTIYLSFLLQFFSFISGKQQCFPVYGVAVEELFLEPKLPLTVQAAFGVVRAEASMLLP